jgi:hypothetical protein
MSQYVLEWSRKTNNFHVQPLSDALAMAQKAFLTNSTNDYRIVMVGTQDVCLTMAENNRAKLLDREPFKLHVVI